MACSKPSIMHESPAGDGALPSKRQRLACGTGLSEGQEAAATQALVDTTHGAVELHKPCARPGAGKLPALLRCLPSQDSLLSWHQLMLLVTGVLLEDLYT